MKTVLITGASSGFGKATAERLLDLEDWTIYATARRVERMRDLAERGAKVRFLDVTDDKAVREVVDEVIEVEGRVDALVANAAHGCYGMIEAVPIEAVRRQFDVNVLGVGRCVRAVLPHMRASRAGRIVITESLASHVSMLGIGWYSATKHALRGMHVALRQEVASFGIDVVAIEPGFAATEFEEVAFRALAEIEHPVEYRELLDAFRAFMADAYDRGADSDSTADAIVEAVTAKRTKPTYRTTLQARLARPMAGTLPARVYDGLLRWLVWRAEKKHEGE